MAVLTTLSIRAQVATPLYISTAEPIRDPSGEIIHGHESAPESTRPLVHIMHADQGIFPPNPDGTPHPHNPLMPGGVTRIGALVTPVMERPGLFTATLNDPRPTSGTLFVRVYNAPTFKESLFYGDSQPMSIEGNKVLYAYVTATDQIIDPARDTDGDGLPDWWEHLHFDGDSTGADPNIDYDGDGMTAEEEFIAGTDPMDSESFLRIYSIEMKGEGHVLTWPGVQERLYDLEYSTNLVQSGFQPLTSASNLVAIDDMIRYTNTPIEAEIIHYRLRVRRNDGGSE